VKGEAMVIQFYPEEHDWVLASLDYNPGSFLGFVCNAALSADDENYELIRPLVLVLMKKYPAQEDLLEYARKQRGG
jgi:hypothetical protein